MFPSKTESTKSNHKTKFIVVNGSTSLLASCICGLFDLISRGRCSLATFGRTSVVA